MNELKLFQSPIFGQVRTVVMNGQVMFAATDVAKCLGYANPQKAIRNHCKSIGVNEMDTPTNGGIQKVRFITKGNVVRLVASSELPQAEQVESWIFDEVIPTVLETGGYISTTPNDTPEEIMARALTIAQATLAKREERLKQLEAQTEQQQATIELQDKEIKEAAPKVNYYNNHLQSVNTLTSTQIAKQIGMDAEKLHKKLKEANVIYRQSGQWLLHSPYSAWGLHSTRTQTYTRSDGSIGTNIYTVWTEKGRRFIIALSESEWNVKKAIRLIKGELEPA
ncbi:MAG: antirepressor protein KilAC domain [Bacteriophage sp.]|jgi:prophage antirepressor-like protein|nr:MAG: antirepressor protein KilAC domain [Bacteriophage sp.]